MSSVSSSTSRPVLIVMSILAGLQILTGAGALGEVIGVKAAGLAIAVVGAAQVGMAFYVQGQVVPNSAVAARVLPGGAIVAGPAAPATVEGQVVKVETKTVPGTAVFDPDPTDPHQL
jgi:hypothetical protein